MVTSAIFPISDAGASIWTGCRYGERPTICPLWRPGRHSGQIVGRSPYLQPVQVEAPASLIGQIAPVSITEVASNSLFGALTQQPALAGAGA